MLEEAIRKSAEEAAAKEEAEKEKKRKEVEKTLPSEPSADVKHAKIRFRIGGDEPRFVEI